MNLSKIKCVACEGGIPPLTLEEINNTLKNLPGWELKNNHLYKSFQFENFYQTMSFVNAIAYIANNENHHPDLEIGYNYCRIYYVTHAVSGITQNDLICAAKINEL